MRKARGDAGVGVLMTPRHARGLPCTAGRSGDRRGTGHQCVRRDGTVMLSAGKPVQSRYHGDVAPQIMSSTETTFNTLHPYITF